MICFFLDTMPIVCSSSSFEYSSCCLVLPYVHLVVSASVFFSGQFSMAFPNSFNTLGPGLCCLGQSNFVIIPSPSLPCSACTSTKCITSDDTILEAYRTQYILNKFTSYTSTHFWFLCVSVIHLSFFGCGVGIRMSG